MEERVTDLLLLNLTLLLTTIQNCLNSCGTCVHSTLLFWLNVAEAIDEAKIDDDLIAAAPMFEVSPKRNFVGRGLPNWNYLGSIKLDTRVLLEGSKGS